MICVQTNARKSGELFRNMFYLKQVELDEVHFILGLQAGLPEEFRLRLFLRAVAMQRSTCSHGCCAIILNYMMICPCPVPLTWPHILGRASS